MSKAKFHRTPEQVRDSKIGRLSSEAPLMTGLAPQTLDKKKRLGLITTFGKRPAMVCFAHLERELVAGHKLPFDIADYQGGAA